MALAVPAIAPGSAYRQTNFVSDWPGVGLIQDPLLVNPWGISVRNTSPFWVANEGTATSTLYRGDVGGSPITKNAGLAGITLTGFLTTEELEQRKQQFAEEFANRAEFHTLYDSFASGQPFVDAVLARAGSARPGVGAAVVATSNRVSVINRLAAGQITRGQALRELMEAPEISQRFFNKAFVVVGYFSFLRRNPDIAYLQWINVLNTTGDYRAMIRGFMQSPEYRFRFGPN